MAPEPRDLPANATPTPGKPYALLVLLQVHWFVRLRWIFAAGALGVLAVERFAVPTAQRPWPLVTVVLGVAAINLVWTAVARLLRSQLGVLGLTVGVVALAIIITGYLFNLIM